MVIRTLELARAISDAVLGRSAVHGLDVTEFTDSDGAAQWRLQTGRPLPGTREHSFADTAPPDLTDIDPRLP